MTLTPAYGRDYKTKKEVQAAWEAGKDFIIADVFGGDCGRYINIDDARQGGIKSVMIRFKYLRNIAVIKIESKAKGEE